jgi:large subunit ribosomal protein L15
METERNNMNLADLDIESMELNNIIGPYNKKKKRLGRGIGTGKGKTSGKGHKGQRARAGARRSNVFQGGQMPLERRLPKKGFTSLNKVKYCIINIEDLIDFKEKGFLGENNYLKISTLIDSKFMKSSHKLKLLSEGEIDFPIHIEVHKSSESAMKKIEAVGGKVVLVGA